MRNVIAIILGGGRGTRLYPLTKHRAKPALPLAGKYRLIDIPVSNCINSGIEQIYILTQFNSASLNRHISNTYRFSPFSKGFVEVLPAQQTPHSPDWYQGTADAVRKALRIMSIHDVTEFLVLSGDHLYRMDYRPFIERHRNTEADVTLSVIRVDEGKASSLGLMKIDAKGRITDFREKPKGSDLSSMKVDFQALGVKNTSPLDGNYMASMGIYIFKREVLIDLLTRNPAHTDFGHDVIPSAIKDFNVQAYLFQGYWEDIGTVEAFYHANLELVRQPNPTFSFYDAGFPIFTRPRFLPPSKILNSKIEESMICDGCIIKYSQIRNSIIGIRSRLEDNTMIENSLIMGADYYQDPEERAADLAAGRPPVVIGANSRIRNAIIDKNARIGQNVNIINKNNVVNTEEDYDRYSIHHGVVIVIKDAIIPDNTII